MGSAVHGAGGHDRHVGELLQGQPQGRRGDREGQAHCHHGLQRRAGGHQNLRGARGVPAREIGHRVGHTARNLLRGARRTERHHTGRASGQRHRRRDALLHPSAVRAVRQDDRQRGHQARGVPRGLPRRFFRADAYRGRREAGEVWRIGKREKGKGMAADARTLDSFGKSTRQP